jgi:hypothetical protein
MGGILGFHDCYRDGPIALTLAIHGTAQGCHGSHNGAAHKDYGSQDLNGL